MSSIGAINLGVRFLLELAMLAALAWWGLTVTDNPAARIALGVGAPVLAIVLWGMFIAPKASRLLADPARVVLEIVLCGLAALGLVSAGQAIWAAVLVVATFINIALMFALNQRGQR